MHDDHWPARLGPRDGTDQTAALADAFADLRAAREKGVGHVVAQLGLSLDGRIATETGDSRYINGTAALSHLHRLRASVDAVLVGAGTARADDPRLNVRLCDGASPARVLIDRRGTVPAHAKVWAADGSRCLVFGGCPGLPRHVERIAAPASRIGIDTIITALADRGLHRILVEGGANTLSRFLEAGLVDELHLLYGRVIIGSGPVGINLPAISRLSAAPRPTGETVVFPDGDLLVRCRLKGRGDQAE